MADQVAGGLLSPWLQRRRFAAIKPHLSGFILDYGCGTGKLAHSVPSSRYTGVDSDPVSIGIAESNSPEHRFLHMGPNIKLSNLLQGRRFDAIILLAVIEHLPFPGPLLKDAAGLLSNAGRIVMTTPNPWLEWSHGLGSRLGLFSREAHQEHQTLIDRRTLKRLAVEAQLRVVSHSHFLFGANQLIVLAPL